MEIKKSNKANLERKKHSIFLFSLVVASGFILTAFEWASYDIDYSLEKNEYGELIEEEPVIQDLIIIQEQSIIQPEQKQEIIDTFVFNNEIDTLPFTNEIVDTTINNIKVRKDSAPPVIRKPIKLVAPPKFVKIADIMPSYAGGDEALFGYLGGKTRYTRIAKELGIEGTVFIQFIVEKDGMISNAKILRGIEPSLDQNALNAVKGMKRWNPGKQREVPVRVQLILPFKYKLN